MICTIRTSSGPYAVGLFAEDSTPMAACESQTEPGQRGALPDLLRAALADVGGEPRAIRQIIVDLGPGGLSSCRVGVSFANALAFGTGAGLCGVSALDLQDVDARGIYQGHAILSLRPGLGQRVFWRLARLGGTVDFGLGSLAECMAAVTAKTEDTVIIGPLQRLKLTQPPHTKCHLHDLTAPSLTAFLQVPKHPAGPVQGVNITQPIVSIDGLHHPHPPRA